jgi:hypothetical protein
MEVCEHSLVEFFHDAGPIDMPVEWPEIGLVTECFGGGTKVVPVVAVRVIKELALSKSISLGMQD